MARNLDIGLLRALAVVADRRGMTAASEVSNLTQGAVGQQIARPEALTGGPPPARDRRGARLTPAGGRLLGKARRLLAPNDEIRAAIDGGAIDGPIRLAMPHDLVGARFAPVLRAHADACPQVELSLVRGSSADLARALAGGEPDLAVLGSRRRP